MILDTNVISELARPYPEPKVRSWLLAQPASSLATTTINVAEIHAGIALLPEGAKRTEVRAKMLVGLQVLAANTFAFDLIEGLRRFSEPLQDDLASRGLVSCAVKRG